MAEIPTAQTRHDEQHEKQERWCELLRQFENPGARARLHGLRRSGAVPASASSTTGGYMGKRYRTPAASIVASATATRVTTPMTRRWGGRWARPRSASTPAAPSTLSSARCKATSQPSTWYFVVYG